MNHDRFNEACEREALAYSGAIQPHGSLLIVDAARRVSHVSANIADWLAVAPEDWLDQPLPDWLDTHLSDAAARIGARSHIMTSLRFQDRALDLIMHRHSDAGWMLECQANEGTDAMPRPAPIPTLRSIADPADCLASQQALVDAVATVTGYDRVMYYRFMADGDGEVIAETLRGLAYGSYLGHRFPASDVPQIARQLYLKNPWRQIPDATLPPVPLLSRDGAVPDLSVCDLRSVAPVHCEYLANMGVRAALSFPVAVNGELTALLACHAPARRQLPLSTLERAAGLVEAHALSLTRYQAQVRMQFIDRLNHRFVMVRQIIQRQGDLMSAWPEVAPLLLEDFAADAAVLNLDGQYTTFGAVDSPALLALLHQIDACLAAQAALPIWESDHLHDALAQLDATPFSGACVLQIRPRNARRARVYLLRAEHLHEITWGGNPDKPAEFQTGNRALSPRRSFEKWVEQRIGYSRPWTTETRLLGFRLRELLADAMA